MIKMKSQIHHFHIAQDTLVQKMHKHCFRFLLRYDSNTQEEFKTNIMGNVKVAHGLLRTPKIMFSKCITSNRSVKFG